MQRLHVIGRKNHGKTQLVVDLVEEFSRRGLRVGTIKHTHHHHELDTPGKDSHRHCTAGAAAVGILSPAMSAIFVPFEETSRDEDRYATFAPLFFHCDLMIVEGDSQTFAPKIEVWRAELGAEPLAAQDASILAIVTDDPPASDIPHMSRADVGRLADWIIERFVRPSTQNCS
jgi:molybdopterin-guanine dinucleotide biosynthesis protein B